MTIFFYGTKEKPFDCFSNFSQHGFEFDGLSWPTSEHYFQAQKYVDTPHYEEVRQAPTPKEAANLGRKYPLRSDWNQVRCDIMRKAVLRKFESHPDIRAILLSTENEDIVENNPKDYYWGCGADGTGQNRFGQVLVEVREILRQREIEAQKTHRNTNPQGSV